MCAEQSDEDIVLDAKSARAVQLDGGAPYETTTTVLYGSHSLPDVGQTLQVFVDPSKPRDVLVAPR